MSALWPEGKDFAFSIFDDTDLATLENVGPVYALLSELGFLTTKSVWPLRGEGRPRIGGATCEDEDYLAWVRELQARGFEIGLHNVAYHTSSREQTIFGLDRFRELFGHDPYTLANHAGCRESIYWGSARLSGMQRLVYDVLLRGRRKGQFEGHVESSPLFWGDICRERVKYVRNFVFGQIDTLAACPPMPYHDPTRPHVRYWFASSEGPEVRSFNAMLSEANQDRLAAAGGACIMYTHFAAGFCGPEGLDRSFRELMTRLSRLNGWFVPVHRLLDHLLETRGPLQLGRRQRARLERRWLAHKLRTRGTS
ncbi:MAG: hypothetical protein JSV80_06830 [Acidobacteriota bacterium]|nr:MAG: hypothetical protein JSV80_06830 [Acidobacteriota bacterium]